MNPDRFQPPTKRDEIDFEREQEIEDERADAWVDDRHEREISEKEN